MRLERKWARRIMVLLGMIPMLFLVMLAACFLLNRDCYVWNAECIFLAGCCGVAAFVLKLRHLRCPNCGRSLAPLRWKPGRRRDCPCCGKPFVFDDESEET